MKNIILLIIFALISLKVLPQNDTIFATIDLKNINNDRVNVELNFKSHTLSHAKEVIFYFPVSIPGTYDDLKYSKYVNDFRAYDKNNDSLEYKKKTLKNWVFVADNNEKIKIGKNRSKEYYYIPAIAERITYSVDDAYDIGSAITRNFIPEANIFEKDKVFQINWGAILGSFIINNNSIYKITVIKPNGLYGATTLKKEIINDTLDVLYSGNYNDLISKPIFYTKPDTTTFTINNSNFELTVFSENGIKYSNIIANSIKPLIEKASNTYLKGLIPEKYIFMYYFSNVLDEGALEHTTSSMYFLSAVDTSAIKSSIIDITAHEFLHILTPLTVRSEKIANSKLYAPYTSKHLWLYEGVTDYFSYQLLLQTKDISPNWFLSDMALNYKDALKKVSMTKMSENVYNKKWNKEYDLVYSKGTLTAFCLDLEIYKLTDGKYRLYDIMMKLKEKYTNKPFIDNRFINEFINLTHKKELNVFFEKYIIGKEKLPVQQYFSEIGCDYKLQIDTIKYVSTELGNDLFFDGSRISIKPNKKHYKEIKGGKIINVVSINGNKDILSNYNDLWGLKDGDYIEYMYKTEVEKLVIKTANITTIIKEYKFVKTNNPSEKQKKLFEEFLNYKYDIN